MQINDWKPAKITADEIKAAEQELRGRPNIIKTLVDEIKLDAVSAQKNAGEYIWPTKEIDAQLTHVLGFVSKLSDAEKLLHLKGAQTYFADLAAQQKAEEQAYAKRRFDQNVQARLGDQRAAMRIAWQERQAKPVLDAVNTCVSKLIALRGRLAPEGLGDWYQQLEDTLDSCRGSVSASFTTAKDGAIELKKAA